MRRVRAGIATAVAIATVLGAGASALADDHGPSYPTRDQVDRARAAVEGRASDLAEVRGELARARAAATDAVRRAEIAAEAYNGARWRLAQARDDARRAAATARRAGHKVATQREGIARLVVRSYQEGTALNGISAFLGDQGPQGVMNRASVVGMAGASMRADYDRFVRAGERAVAAKEQAERAARRQRAEADRARSARSAAAAAVRSAQDLAAAVGARRQQVVAELAAAKDISIELAERRQAALEEKAQRAARAKARREAREAAAAEARERAREAAAQKRAQKAQQKTQQQAQQAQEEPREQPADPEPSGSAPPQPSQPVDPPAPSGGAAAAIAFARAQVGEPYRWGAAGPSRWDCSGLTMMAWRAAGVSLPHYSAAQYDAGTPIPIADAGPGDLYFWSSNGRPSGIHHVALAVGGGRFLEAPYTGANVRYNSVGDWYPDFAVRL